MRAPSPGDGAGPALIGLDLPTVAQAVRDIGWREIVVGVEAVLQRAFSIDVCMVDDQQYTPGSHYLDKRGFGLVSRRFLQRGILRRHQIERAT